MDKAQKELVKTYFRARMMLENVDSEGFAYTRLENYENIEDFIEMGLVDVTQFKRDHIIKILKDKPQTIKAFKPVLDKIDPQFVGKDKMARYIDFSEVIGAQPELIKYFDSNKLDWNQITRLIIKHPDLITKFKDQLPAIEYNGVGQILFNHPELVEYFDLTEVKKDHRWMLNLLLQKPQLTKYLDGVEDVFSIVDVSRILERNPDYIKIVDLNKFPPKEIENYLDSYHSEESKKLIRKKLKM